MSLSVHLDRSKFGDQQRKLEQMFDKRLKDLKAETAQKTSEAVIYVAQRLGEQTFPSSKAIGMAVSAVRFDISRVYITAGKAFEILRESAGAPTAGAFYAAIKQSDFSKAQRILRSSACSIQNIQLGTPLNPALHEKSRNANGRVILAAPLQIVTQPELQTYTKTVVARLGKTASGWYACAERMGGDGNSIRWKGTAIHGSDGGKVNVRNDNSKVRYILTNLRPLARKLISPGQVARILEDGREFLARLLAAR